jgi:hypothetical protein
MAEDNIALDAVIDLSQRYDDLNLRIATLEQGYLNLIGRMNDP